MNDILAQPSEIRRKSPLHRTRRSEAATKFTDQIIPNESYSTADDQLGRPGDFLVGQTAFHVTVAPMIGVYDKCLRNLEAGLRAYLLVPDRVLAGARLNTDQVAPGRISVDSIESFVAFNVEEQAGFSQSLLAERLRDLIEIYNSRVDEVELDKSLMMTIPPNLALRQPA